MPQLDKFSFATQLFWFCSFFIFYYILVVNKFLPIFFKILRFRFYRLKLFSIGVKFYLSEEVLILTSYINLINEEIKLISSFITLYNKTYLFWINLSRTELER